jgi:hypothetical protein
MCKTTPSAAADTPPKEGKSRGIPLLWRGAQRVGWFFLVMFCFYKGCYCLKFIDIPIINPLAPIEAVSFFYLVFFDEIKKDTSE